MKKKIREQVQDLINFYRKDMKVGKLSDGHHTFNELYEERAYLFAALCQAYRESSWKSELHYDGTFFKGYFLAGIDTPDGTVSFHIKNKYWDIFKVRTLTEAPKWGEGDTNNLKDLLSLSLYHTF